MGGSVMPKATPGAPWRPPAADQQNAWDEAADHYKRAFQNSQPGNQQFTPRDTNIIKIRNDSGAARDRFDVLAINGPLILPSANATSFLSQPAAKGIQPQVVADGTTHVGSWAILLEPAKDGAIVKAAVGGYWACIVDCQHPDHRWADVVHEEYALASNWYGSAEILWHESWDAGTWSSGAGKAFVRIGNFTSQWLDGTVDEASGIDFDDSGTVSIYWKGAATDPLSQVEAEYSWIQWADNIPDDAKVRIAYNRERAVWEIRQHECV